MGNYNGTVFEKNGGKGMKNRGVFSILAILAVFAMVTLGCPDAPTAAVSKEEVKILDIYANGVYNLSTTTKLYLTFSKTVEGLTEDDITLTGGAVTKKTLSKDENKDTLYILEIDVTADAKLTVVVNKPGDPDNIIPGPAEPVEVYYKAPNPGDTVATLSKVEADGSTAETTTKLTLTFDTKIIGLNVGDIELSGVSGVAKKDMTQVTSDGKTWSMPIIGFTESGTLKVTVTKIGYNIKGSGVQVDIYYVEEVEFTSLTADGGNDITTTEIYLGFNKTINGLSAENITLSGVPGVPVKGTLKNPGGSLYVLPISGFTAGGTLNVEVSKLGFKFTPSSRTTPIYFRVEDVELSSVTANGSASETTTELTLTFDKAIPGLSSSSDITLTGAGPNIKMGLLSGAGPVYTLPISDFETTDGEATLKVAVSKLPSYNITPADIDVTIYYKAIDVELSSVTANGAAGTTNTTELTLTFDNAIPGLSADDITLTSTIGATKGALSGTGPTYTLPISGFTAGGTLTVAVKKFGYEIDPASIDVEIFYVPPVTGEKNVIKVEGTGAAAKLVHYSPGEPNLTVSNTTPYSGTAKINDDGTVTISAGTNNVGGALLYKFPTDDTDATKDYKSYDIVTVEYELVDKEQGTGGTGNCEIAIRTWGTRTPYSYDIPNAYPDLMISTNNPLIYTVRGAETTGGFTWEHNSWQWSTNDRYETYVIRINKITFSKVPHYTVTFDVGYDGGTTYTERDYLENDPLSRLGALPSPSQTGFVFDGWFAPGGTSAVSGSTIVTSNMNLTGQWTAGTLSPLIDSSPTFNGYGSATGNVSDGITLGATSGGSGISYTFPDGYAPYATVTLTVEVSITTPGSGSSVQVVRKTGTNSWTDTNPTAYPTLNEGSNTLGPWAVSMFPSGGVSLQQNNGVFTIKITKVQFDPE